MRFFLLKKGKILFSIPSMASKRKVEGKMKMVIMAKVFQLLKFYAAIMIPNKERYAINEKIETKITIRSYTISFCF